MLIVDRDGVSIVGRVMAGNARTSTGEDVIARRLRGVADKWEHSEAETR